MHNNTSLSQGISKKTSGKTPNNKIGRLSLDDKIRKDRSIKSIGLVARFIRENNLVYCQITTTRVGYPTEIYLIGRIDRSGLFQWSNVSLLSTGGGQHEILEVYHSDDTVTERESKLKHSRGGVVLAKNTSVDGKIYRKQCLLTKWTFLERLGIDPSEVDSFEQLLERDGYKIPKNRSLRNADRLATKKDKSKRKKLLAKIEYR